MDKKTKRKPLPSKYFPWLLVVIFLLLIASSRLNLSEMGYTENIYLSIIVIQMLIFMIPAVFYIKLRDINSMERLGFNPFPPSYVLLMLLFLGVMLFGSIAIKLIMYGFGYSSDNYSLYSELTPSGNTGSMATIYIVLAVSLVPAVVEEFIFRALAISEYLESNLGPVSVSVITSLLFAMVHFTPEQLPVYFFSGLVLAALTLLTGSVFPAMAVHFLNNLISLFFESYLQRLIKSGNATTLTFISIAGLILCIALSFFFLSRKFKAAGKSGKSDPDFIRPNEPKKNKRKNILYAISSPGFIMCVLIFIIYSILKAIRLV